MSDIKRVQVLLLSPVCCKLDAGGCVFRRKDSQSNQTRSQERFVFVRNQLRKPFRLLVSFQSFSGFTFMDKWDSFKGNIAVVSQKDAAAFLGKPGEAVTEEEVLKRLKMEAEIIEKAINGDLFEVCGPESDDFGRHGWFLDEEEAVKFALEEYPDFKYKDEDFRTIYELKTA